MKFKLLVNPPQGEQKLIPVSISGSYFDESRVLWDERKDGKFPDSRLDHVGFLKRVDNKLVIDYDLRAAYDSRAPQRELVKIIEQRKLEYPDLAECIHALLDGGATLDELQAKREAVKAKYPKP